jgi:hypothetical protein
MRHQLVEDSEEHKLTGGFSKNVPRQEEDDDEQGTFAEGTAPIVQSPLMSEPPLNSASSDLEEMCKAAAAGHYGNRSKSRQVAR